MRSLSASLVFTAASLLLASPFVYADILEFTDERSEAAAANYQKYCALCHGDDRQGHVNDHAPSLKSRSLMSAGVVERVMTIAYGRRGTPMASFYEEVGGPLNGAELSDLVRWLQKESGIEAIDLPEGPVTGDIDAGKEIYDRDCSVCHGAEGEGVTGTALGNPVMLSLTSDHFLRYAIVNGRDGTPMPAFGDKLAADEIDAVTAFLRSRASGWAVEKPVFRTPPTVGEYILNPESDAPAFKLKDGRYVLSADLYAALQAGKRMVVLDTRVMSLWQMAHIEGSVPIPYYFDQSEAIFNDLPTDGTWIVTYCECPRSAAESVNRKLVAKGFTNTAVLWEGIQGWISLGYPVFRGESTMVDKKDFDQLTE